MRWQIYQRATGREVLQLDAPNHPAAIAAAKLTGLDGEAIGARAVVRTSVPASLTIPAALSALEAIGAGVRVRRLEVLARKRWGRDPIFIEHTGVRGDREADRWAIRSEGSSKCYGRDGWEYEPLHLRIDDPSSRNDAFFERCRWTLEEALRAVEAMRDEEPVAGGSS